jgi:hypothetical protein
MQRKYILVLGVIVLIAVVAGGWFLMKDSQNETENTPLENSEIIPIEGEMPVDEAGFNECIRKVEERQDKENACVKGKLEAKSYTDGLDCAQENENPVCQAGDRYNAQIEAENECREEFSSVSDTSSELSCASTY